MLVANVLGSNTLFRDASHMKCWSTRNRWDGFVAISALGAVVAFVWVGADALDTHHFGVSEWIALLNSRHRNLILIQETIFCLCLHWSNIFFTLSVLCRTVKFVAFATLFEGVHFEVKVES